MKDLTAASGETVGCCRICAAGCILHFQKDRSGRITSARGAPDHPITGGYACSKGLLLHEAHYSPERLLHPLKRMSDGRFVRVPATEALDEIAYRLRKIIDDHGPDAVGAYRGTFGYDHPLFQSLLTALNSRSFFSTLTIDQSAKVVTAGRLGTWDAGKDQFHDADVLLLTGTNPLVSNTTFDFPVQNPLRHLRMARNRGLKLIVIDPRYTETAKQADLFVQPFPGTDAILFAGIIREVMEKAWVDQEFCNRHAQGVELLRHAVAPFTADLVARRAGIRPDEIREVARIFAEPLQEEGAVRRRRGAALGGTGPDMGPHSNLAEHLIECLNVLCGRYARPGDLIANPGVFAPPRRYRAQVVAPGRPWENGWTSEATGYGTFVGEKMCGTLADEILVPSSDQVRALICDSGNPVNAVPDQGRIVAALRSLELLVTIDPFMTNTAQLSHFILPPPMVLERASAIHPLYETAMMPWPMSRYSPSVIERPEGAELLDGWEVAFQLAQRLGVVLDLSGQAMDMTQQPSELAMLRQMCRTSRVPFDEIIRHPPGHVFSELPNVYVEQADPDADARFDLAPADVREELLTALADKPALGFTHILAVRRTREILNTTIHHPSARQRRSYNPAYLNPRDMEKLALAEGDYADLISPYGQAIVRVGGDPDVKMGVVSFSHGWGGLPGKNAAPDHGTNSNLLTSSTEGRESINAMPVMTGVPVRIGPRPATSPHRTLDRSDTSAGTALSDIR